MTPLLQVLVTHPRFYSSNKYTKFCISSFSIAVIKHRGQVKLEGRVHLAYGFRGIREHAHHNREERQQDNMVLETAESSHLKP